MKCLDVFDLNYCLLAFTSQAMTGKVFWVEEDENLIFTFSDVNNQYCYIKEFVNDESLINQVLHRRTKKLTLVNLENIRSGKLWENHGFARIKEEYYYEVSQEYFEERAVNSNLLLISLAESREDLNSCASFIEENLGQAELAEFNNCISNAPYKNKLFRCHIAKLADIPVAVSIQFIVKGTSLLMWLVTNSDYTNQDLDEIMMQHAFVDAHTAGLDTFLLRTLSGPNKKALKKGCQLCSKRTTYEKNNEDYFSPNLLLTSFCRKNAVLKTRQEYLNAIYELNLLGLPKHKDLPKNWDSLAAVYNVFEHTQGNKESAILDAGGEYYSMILPQLAALGYNNLRCINLCFSEKREIGNITYEYGDITQTHFSDHFFDAITCQSVIEHGVDLEYFFREMARIIKPDGMLFISTDYWHQSINTENKIAYGSQIKIFSSNNIDETVSIAEKYGFETVHPIELDCEDKVVEWKKYGLKYTFIYIVLKKIKQPIELARLC